MLVDLGSALIQSVPKFKAGDTHTLTIRDQQTGANFNCSSSDCYSCLSDVIVKGAKSQSSPDLSIEDKNGGFFYALLVSGLTYIAHGHIDPKRCDGSPGFVSDTNSLANAWKSPGAVGFEHDPKAKHSEPTIYLMLRGSFHDQYGSRPDVEFCARYNENAHMLEPNHLGTLCSGHNRGIVLPREQ
jgi:hypothetical protein